jgi:hypothetical protein
MFFHKLDLKSEEHMYVIASKFAEIFKQSPEKTREAYLQFIRKFADEGNSSPFTEISSTDFIAAFKSVDPGIESFYRIGSIVPENPLLGEVVLKGPSSMAEYLTTPLHKENIHHLIASSNYARVTRADSAMTRGLISGGLNKIHQGGSWALLNWARAHYIHIGPGNIESSNAVRELVRLINESTSFTIHNVNSEGDKVMADIFEAAKMDDSIFGEMLEYAIKIIDESKPIYKL